MKTIPSVDGMPIKQPERLCFKCGQKKRLLAVRWNESELCLDCFDAIRADIRGVANGVTCVVQITNGPEVKK